MKWRVYVAILLFILPLFFAGANVSNGENTSQPSIWIMHPAENNLYLGYRDIYLGTYYIETPFSIIVGSIVYYFLYGVWVVTDKGVEKVEMYVDGKFVKVETEPYGEDENTCSWLIHWCVPGFHEITVIAYDSSNNAAIAQRDVMVIL